MSKQKLIYISGKMGENVLSEATVKKFEVAQNKLLNDGWAVINPASPVFQRDAQKHVKIEEKKWQQIEYGEFDWYAWLLLWDMHLLALCDAIYMLSDWQDSPGATSEYYYAQACGKEIIMEKLRSGKPTTAIAVIDKQIFSPFGITEKTAKRKRG